VTPTASSTLTVITTVNTPTGSPQLTIRGTSGTLTHDAYVTLNVGGGGATGTITVRGYSGTMEVPVTGNIKETDTGTVVVSSFSTAPPNAYSWDQAVANRRYTVAAYYNGIPREEIVTVAAGAIRNVNPQFLQVVTGEFPLWAVAVVGGGVLAVGVYALATRKPSRKR
jgi:nitrate reductase NapE component